MSDFGLSQEELLETLTNGQITSRFAVAAMALLAYDCIVMFDREVKCIWKRKWSAVTVIYAGIRYCTLLNMILQNISAFVENPVSLASCKFVQVFTYMMDLSSLFMVAAFSCIRIWAICGQKWVPFALVFATSMFGPIINLYNFSNPLEFSIITDGPFKGCNAINTKRFWRGFPILSRSIAFSSDLLVLIFTWRRTVGIVKESREVGMSAKLSTLLLHNGALQFVALSILNAVTILLDVLKIAVSNTFGIAGTEFIYVNQAISAILICHFLLDLRNIYISEGGTEISQSEVTTLRFSDTLVGNAGAPLDSFLHLDHDDSLQTEETAYYSKDPFEFGLQDGYELETFSAHI